MSAKGRPHDTQAPAPARPGDPRRARRRGLGIYCASARAPAELLAGPGLCAAWHNASVTVYWDHPGGPTTISEDTGGTVVSCTASNAEGSVTSSALVRKDGTPPGVRIALDRGPDSNGWYNHAVRAEFTGDDGLSGIGACSPTATYSGPDGGSVSISGSCTDGAGNTGSGSVQIPYDATPPSVEGKPDRPPDKNGWYNRAVTVNFVGTDHASGLHVCTAPVVYSGPDAAKASLSGICQDKAANTSQPKAVELSYDATPPLLKRVKAEISRRGIATQVDRVEGRRVVHGQPPPRR